MKDQIEKHELSYSIYMSGHGLDHKDSDDIAEQLYTEGYRKQNEGEWLNAGMFDDMAKCSVCGLMEHSLNEVYSRGTEVAREIFEEIEKIRLKEIHKCETLRERENEASQRMYWEGGYNSLRQLSYWISELKKKYTEEKT